MKYRVACLAFLLLLLVPSAVISAGDAILEETNDSEADAITIDAPDWDEIQGQIQSGVHEVEKRLETLRDRLPELNEQLENVRSRMPKVQARMERAQKQARKAAEKAIKISTKSLEEARRQICLSVGEIAAAGSEEDFDGYVLKEETEHEFAATRDTSLVVRTEFAEVSVRAEERETVLVTVLKKAGAQTEKEAQANLEALEASVEQSGDEIRVTAGLKSMKSSGNEFRRFQITVLLPSSLQTDIENRFGPVKLDGVQAKTSIHNEFGPMEIENTSGPLEINSSYGGIRLSNITITDDIAIKSEFGPITLDLQEDTNAELSATTSFGEIHCDFPVEGKRTGTELKATLGQGGPSVEITNSFAGIDIKGRGIQVSKGFLKTESLFEIPEIPPIPIIPKIEIPEIRIPEIRFPEMSAIVPQRPHSPETYLEEWTIPLEDLGKIDNVVIQHDHGNIRVVGSDSGPYEIKATKRIWAESEERAKEVADQYTLEATYSRSTLKVESRRPRNTPKDVNGASIDYTITIPPAMALQVNADHGNFESQNTIGDVEIEHDHGNIELRNINGNLTSNSDHGNFEARDVTGDLEIFHDHGNVNLETIGGKIVCEAYHGELETRDVTGETIEIEHDHGKVTLRNASGRIKCKNAHADTRLEDVHGPVELEFEHGNARIVASDPLEGRWEINGGHGSCYLVLPAGAGASLSLDANRGRISTGWDAEVHRERSHESAEIERNGGGTPITITVQYGNININ